MQGLGLAKPHCSNFVYTGCYAHGGPTRAAIVAQQRVGLPWDSGPRQAGCAAAALVAADSIRSAPVKFLYRGFAHSVAAPLRKKARSARLLGCKRPRDSSLSLPTFCRFEFTSIFFAGVFFFYLLTRHCGLRIVRGGVFSFRTNAVVHSLRRSSFQN